MNLESLRSHFRTSPAIRLLRADAAPYVIDFLNRAFRQPGRVGVPIDELHDALAAYLDDVREGDPDAPRDTPAAYLSDWCSGDKRWLRRTLEGAGDTPTYQLTPHAQEVLTYLDRALNSDLGFVGTESRLRLVIETLNRLAVEASDDPDERLAHLRTEKARVEAEIAQIERGGPVTRLPAAHVRERFDTAGGQELRCYTDGAGQSGGEKAKLAFTVLAAAIADQYDIDPARPAERFRFVVIDEMFSKVDDRHAEYALRLFARFGLQLLIVERGDAKACVADPYADRYLLVVKGADTNCSAVHAVAAREVGRDAPPAPAPRAPARPVLKPR